MADAQALRRNLIKTVAERIVAHADELTTLDQAIGDGDHGINMKRGMDAVLADLDKLAEKPLGEALKAAGMHLVTRVGGASGPLYGTLFMSLGKGLSDIPDRPALAAAFRGAVDAVKARGKSDGGMKTMLDVLLPLAETLENGGARPDGGNAQAGQRGRGGHHAAAGDPRPRLVPGRAVQGPYGSRRAIQPADA